MNPHTKVLSWKDFPHENCIWTSCWEVTQLGTQGSSIFSINNSVKTLKIVHCENVWFYAFVKNILWEEVNNWKLK